MLSSMKPSQAPQVNACSSTLAVVMGASAWKRHAVAPHRSASSSMRTLRSRPSVLQTLSAWRAPSDAPSESCTTKKRKATEEATDSSSERVLLLDPTFREESAPVSASHMCVAYLPGNGQISHLSHSGEVDAASISDMIGLCVEGCGIMHSLMKSALEKEHGNEAEK